MQMDFIIATRLVNGLQPFHVRGLLYSNAAMEAVNNDRSAYIEIRQVLFFFCRRKMLFQI